MYYQQLQRTMREVVEAITRNECTILLPKSARLPGERGSHEVEYPLVAGIYRALALSAFLSMREIDDSLSNAENG